MLDLVDIPMGYVENVENSNFFAITLIYLCIPALPGRLEADLGRSEVDLLGFWAGGGPTGRLS